LISDLESNDLPDQEENFTNPLENFDFSIFSENENKILDLKYNVGIKSEKSINAKQILIKLENKAKIEDRLSKKYIKLLNIRNMMRFETDRGALDQLKIEEQKIKNSKRKLEMFSNKISLLPTNLWIGNQLGIKSGTVSSYLNRIKIKFQKNGIPQAIA